MNPTTGGHFSKPTPHPRPRTGLGRDRLRTRPRCRSGLAVSGTLHLVVLVALLRVADLTPAPVRFDVFAADPIEAAAEHAVAEASPEPPRPRPTAALPKGRVLQSARPPVRSVRPRAAVPARPVGARSVAPPSRPGAAAPATGPVAAVAGAVSEPGAHPSPPDRTVPIAALPAASPSVAPAHADLSLSAAASSDAVEEPAPAPGSLAALEPPTQPSPPTVGRAATSGQPDVPAPRAAAAKTVIAPGPETPAVTAAEPLEPVPAMPLAAAPPTTTASAPAPVPAPQPPSTPVAVPPPSPPLAESGDAEPLAQTTPAPVPPPRPSPPKPPIRIETAEQSTPSSTVGLVAAEPARPPVIARAASEASRPADSPAVLRDSSPLGLGLGRLQIRLDGASMRTTDHATDVISGTLVGGQPERVVVQIDEQTSVPTLAGRAFATAVKLSPGVNRVRVLAIDAQGGQVEEVVTVQYKPPMASPVTITSPRDGHTLGPEDPPLVTVQGEVADPGLGAVWIVANDLRVMAPITAGRFRYVLPVLEPTVRVRAETGGEDGRSATVTVDATAALPAIGLFLEDWPRDTPGPTQMTVTWRPDPARLDGGAYPVQLRESATDTGEGARQFFYLRSARPGVYTFLMTYRGGVAPRVRPVLSVAGASRPLQPVALDGSGRVVVARVLLPQGVLWEQDDWFTGRSASGDTVTKFRFPEGVSWIERVRGLGR
jgi:hypothetical protein